MSATSPSRRRFLAGGVAAALSAAAGCLGALDGRTDAPAARDGSERALVLSLSREGESLRDRFVRDLAETRPEHDEAAFEATLDGRAYTTQYRKPFFSRPDDPVYAERNGTYYRLGSVVVDEVSVTRPVLRLYPSDDRDAAVEASRLPESDRRAVHIAHLAARARGDEGGVPWGLVQRGGYVFRRDSAADASRLLASDGPDVLSFRDRVYEVRVARERFHEPVYRATVEPVADSPERMEAVLRAQFVDARFSRADRSPEAREVLRAARDGEYRESHPYSSGYEEVLRALHRRAFLDGNVRKDAGVTGTDLSMVRYDGVYYEYRLRFRSDGTA
jgi:hypothetical protein